MAKQAKKILMILKSAFAQNNYHQSIFMLRLIREGKVKHSTLENPSRIIKIN